MKRKIVLLGVLLGIGSLAWGQKASVMIMVKQEHVTPKTTGMVVRYCEYAKFQQAEKQGKKVVWDSVGTIAKPIQLTNKEENKYVYILKGLDLNTRYILQAYLVNNKKKTPLTIKKVFVTAENDEDPSNMPLLNLQWSESTKP